MGGSDLSGQPHSARQEIERKFLLEALPPQVADTSSTRIIQGYLAITDDVEVRVRARAADRLLTVKQGRGAVRREVTISLDVELFEQLWEFTVGRRIHKRRWVIPYGPQGELQIEVDRFNGHLEGLLVAEVEFASVADSRAFTPPDWFGREVTDDDRYRNAALALGPPP